MPVCILEFVPRFPVLAPNQVPDITDPGSQHWWLSNRVTVTVMGHVGCIFVSWITVGMCGVTQHIGVFSFSKFVSLVLKYILKRKSIKKLKHFKKLHILLTLYFYWKSFLRSIALTFSWINNAFLWENPIKVQQVFDIHRCCHFRCTEDEFLKDHCAKQNHIIKATGLEWEGTCQRFCH